MRRPAWSPGLLALLLYLALALFLAWPVAGAPATDFLTTHFDSFGHLWRAWNLGRTGLGSLDWLRDSDLLLYPTGSNIPGGSVVAAVHGSTCVLTLYLLTRVLPEALAWNLSLVLAITLTGWAAWLLVREVTGSARAAWLAGLLLLLSPGYLEEAFEGVLEGAALFPLLLYLLFAIRWLRSRRRREGLAALAFLALATLTSVYQAIMALAASLAVFLVLDRSVARRAAVVLALFTAMLVVRQFHEAGSAWREASGLLLSPAAASEILVEPPDDLDREGAGQAVYQVLRDSVAPADFFWRSSPESLKSHCLQPLHFFAFLGLLLAFRRTWPWALAGLCFGLWALGPYVIRHGPVLGPAAPAWLLYAVAPPLAEIRPGRLWMAAQICAMVGAGLGLRVLLDRVAGSATRVAFVMVAVALLALVDFLCLPPFLNPCSVVSGEVPAFYERVREDPSTRALVEWPLFPATGVLWGKALHAQTRHGKSLVNCGMRGPETLDVLRRWQAENALVRFLVDPDATTPVGRDDVQALSGLGIRYVVVHDRVPADPFRFFPQDREQQLFPVCLLDGLERFLGPPAVREDGLLAYETVPAADPGERSYDRQAFSETWLRFPPSATPQRAVLEPREEPRAAARVSFWFRCREGSEVLEASVEDRGAPLARARIVAERDDWKRVDLPLARPYRGGGHLTLSLARPGSPSARTVELYRVEVTRPRDFS